jgi:hypothetical protein
LSEDLFYFSRSYFEHSRARKQREDTMGRLSRAGEYAFDAITAALSISDIVADIAVAVEFYSESRTELFCVSMAIFGLAQAAYSFLFVATFGAHLSNSRKTLAFLVALPLAQFTPVFTLVESYHLPCISGALMATGLRPTKEREAAAADTDSLWTLVQRKYKAHAGFLVEALVEAIPQCALQITAVVLARESSALNIISIILSLSVIGSKGWLASYSLHRPSFLFNSLCMAADVACVFATAAWLAATWRGFPGFREGDSDMTTSQQHLSSLWVYLLLVAAASGVIGGSGVLVFSVTDDHLKARDKNPDTGIYVTSVFFEIYVLRAAAWLLSILPCVTLLALLHLSLLPLLAFRSLSSEHARHHAFFAALFSFVRDGTSVPSPSPTLVVASPDPPCPTEGEEEASEEAPSPPSAAPEATSMSVTTTATSLRAGETASSSTAAPRSTMESRLASANALIGLAYAHADDLSARLSRIDAVAPQSEHDRVTKAWAMSLGRARARLAASPELAEPVISLGEAAMAAAWATPTPVAPPPVAPMSRWERRLALLRFYFRRHRSVARSELAKRSEVFRRLFGGQRRQIDRGGIADHLIYGTALAGVAVALLASLPAAVAGLALVPLGALFPLVQLGLSCSAPEADAEGHLLPRLLTIVYAAFSLLLLFLLPSVRRFQMLRIDIVPTSGLPAPFFNPVVVREMERRHALLSSALAEEHQEEDCSVCLAPITPECSAMLRGCGHLFHAACIEAWVHERPSCPLCRTHAALDDIMDGLARTATSTSPPCSTGAPPTVPIVHTVRVPHR